MFEVGKHYKFGNTGNTRECVWVGDKHALMRYIAGEIGGRPLIVTHENEFINWKEVKPRHKLWLNIYKGFTCTHSTKELAEEYAGLNRVACIPIEYEEGEGLSV